jgi:hypothetical protein
VAALSNMNQQALLPAGGERPLAHRICYFNRMVLYY